MDFENQCLHRVMKFHSHIAVLVMLALICIQNSCYGHAIGRPMRLVLLSNAPQKHGAMCLDGSPPGFYFRPGMQKTCSIVIIVLSFCELDFVTLSMCNTINYNMALNYMQVLAVVDRNGLSTFKVELGVSMRMTVHCAARGCLELLIILLKYLPFHNLGFYLIFSI